MKRIFIRIVDNLVIFLVLNIFLAVRDVSAQGYPFAWGDNTYSQTNVPPDLNNAVAVAAGLYHCLALKDDGTIIAWGNNDHGQTDVPAGLSNVVAISAGGNYSLALRIDGTMVSWGDLAYRPTNVTASFSNITAIAVGGQHSLALRTDGTVVAWGLDNWGQVDVPAGLSNILSIAAGAYDSMALRIDGRVVIWGRQVGRDPRVPTRTMLADLRDVVAIAAVDYHSMALRADGTVVSWGNYLGYCQLNVPAALTNIVAISAGNSYNLALRADGTVLAWDNNSGSQANVPTGLRNVTAIAAGQNFSIALVGTGEPRLSKYVAGGNITAGGPAFFTATAIGVCPLSYQWQLNGVDIATATNWFFRSSNIQTQDAGTYRVFVTNPSGSITSSEATVTVVSSPPVITVQPESVTTWPGSHAGFFVSVLGTDPRGYQWRFNSMPLAGDRGNSLELTNLSLSQSGEYDLVVTNNYGAVTSQVAVLDVNPVEVWGTNGFPFNRSPAGLSNVVSIAAANYILGLRDDGTPVEWGGFHEMSSILKVPVSYTNLVSIAASLFYALGLSQDGTVLPWGMYPPWRTGLSNMVAISAGNFHDLALMADGTVAAWGRSNAGITNVPPGLNNVVAIAAGYSHSLALRGEGTVVAWGSNSMGQCNVPAGLSNVVAIAAGWFHSLALRDDGTIWGWGSNALGEANSPTGLGSVVAIAGGHYFSVALRGNGTVVAWGLNNGGQLNLPADLDNVVAIAAGQDDTAVLVDTGGPRVRVAPASQTLPTGGSTLLTVTALGACPLWYQWQFNGQDIAGSTNWFLRLSSIHANQAGSYRVIVSNTKGSITSPAATLTVMLPDLAPIGMNAPATALSGQIIQVGCVVTNQGNGTAFPSWNDRLYLSTNTIWDTTAYEIGSWTQNQPVTNGTSYAFTNTVKLPNWPDGMYYLIVTADSDNNLVEQDKQNNSMAKPIAFGNGVIVNWANPAAIVYSTALDADQLNATANVPGTFTYSPAAGTVPNAGTGLILNVTFIPTDTTNFTAVTAAVLLNVQKRALTVTGYTAANKVYDGTRNTSISGTPVLTGVIGNDLGIVNGTATGVFASKTVGNNKTVTIAGLSLSGAAEGNYTLNVPSLRANIAPASLTISGLATSSKVYDGTTLATISGIPTLVGVIGNDDVTMNGTAIGAFDSKMAGINKTVLVTGLSLNGADAGNYMFGASSLRANITPASLTISGLAASAKVYDGTTAITITGTPVLAGVVGSDVLTLEGTSTGAFVTKTIGNNKAVIVTGLSLGGANAGNYTLNVPSLFANITRAPLTVTGLAAVGKVYDGTTAAIINGTPALAGIYGIDAVILNGTATGVFASKTVGNNKTVTVTGLSLSGADAGNYLFGSSTLSADITPALLTVSGLTADSKVYDGTITAMISGTPLLMGVIRPDVVTVSWAMGAFQTKTVDINKPVMVTGLSLSGADAGNYKINPFNLSADIMPAQLTVSGFTISDKVYDGTTMATISGTPLLLGVISPDAVTLSGAAVGAFASKTVGNNKTVTVTGLTLSGTARGNYTLNMPSLSVNITPAPIAVIGLAATSKVYDGTTAAIISGTPSPVGVIGSDVVTLNGVATGAFDTKTVGNFKPVMVTGLSIDGADAGNYTLGMSTLNAGITPALLTVSANDTNRVYGATNPAFSGTIAGLQGGDNIIATYSCEATISSPAGAYLIVPHLTDPDGNLVNYTTVLNNGTLTVNMLAVSAPRMSNAKLTGGTFSVSVSTDQGWSYVFEYKSTLSDVNWTEVITLPGVVGTVTFTDTGATGRSRYYRIRVQ